MEHRRMAVHRTIVVVDVEGFGDRDRTNRNQMVVRDGLYKAMRDAFHHAGIPWADDSHEDRGDGLFILVPADVPKGLFVESLPSALVMALRAHNASHPHEERIRLRVALHAGEVHYDEHGVTAASINLAFRLLEARGLKEALAASPGVLAVIASSWFYEEVVRHSTANTNAYRRLWVTVKETSATGWICLPDHLAPAGESTPKRAPTTAAVPFAPPVRALRTAYTTALAKPITLADAALGGLQIPTLGEGYIDHRIRVARVGVSAEPTRESWWDNAPVSNDVHDFFTRHLISTDALEVPLILLGQPGSGKSVLTRILAARLPSADFLPVRVELRQVPAEADLQDQIEFAVRDTIGERLSWPQLVGSGHGALPVVMLDGFDELLQATGVMQTDYLLRVQAFQEREAVQGRPLAVIVTSRTAVADRARIPQGTVAVRLEPFNEAQVAAWLKVWEQTNRVALERRGMRPLPTRIALNHKELAEQPLLLLMLALYDAETNILQRRWAGLSRTELYGRLLKEFARREIGKHSGILSEFDLESAVEAELLRLSVVAFAMFNRRSQWVSELDLDADIAVLMEGNGDGRHHEGRRAPLTAAQVAISRFFFIYTSKATRGNRQLQSYEFLHATFGEFLVAWRVSQLLNDMLTPRAPKPASSPNDPGDELLYALLSFAALTASSPVVMFLDDLIGEMDAARRAELTELLLRLHAQSLYSRPESAYRDYEPLPLTVTTRHAAWSANLVLLVVLAAGQVTSTQLFPEERDSGLAWRNCALMWRSQLAGRGWEGLYETIALKRIWDGQRREILLWRNDGTFIPPPVDIYWTYTLMHGLGDSTGLGPAERKRIFTEQAHNSLLLLRKTNFVCNMAEDTVNHGSLPITSSFPAVANVFVMLDGDRAVSATHALAAALIEPYQDRDPGGQVYRDLASVVTELARTPSTEPDRGAYVKLALAVLTTAVERGAASPAVLGPLADAIDDRLASDLGLTNERWRIPEPSIGPDQGATAEAD
jgi:hypothetical protein